ncbi:hypothetical protein [Aliikangiella sp. IMCC44359]|uniref:hypothetical protein n=1 Tax=Aliikangiella sp. IMCC44359 TaxID=3459125 RepID=UPI00403ACA22
MIKSICIDTDIVEGYVIRLEEPFHYSDFADSVAKWVRAEHVQTDQHWMYGEIKPNGLAKKPHLVESKLAGSQYPEKEIVSYIEGESYENTETK